MLASARMVMLPVALVLMAMANEKHRDEHGVSAPSRKTAAGSGWLVYVATWTCLVYVAFVIDVFARRIVGWRASRVARTDFVLDTL